MEESIRLPAEWAGWRITEWIGGGSYGDVYEAEFHQQDDFDPGRKAAIKIIRIPRDDAEAAVLAHEIPDPSARSRYLEDLADHLLMEIRTMDLLKDHPHAVAYQDSYVDHTEDGLSWTIYLRMELLTPFEEYRIDHEMKEADVIRLGTEMCGILSLCENNQILHRDIKPENIMVSPDGTFKLGDFGLARQLSEGSGSLSIKGSFTYMSPEVYHGRPYDARADQYSLGLVLYRLLNKNRDPFTDPAAELVYYRDREESLQKRMSGESLPLPSDASPNLARVIAKACAFRPEDRYKNFSDLQHDLLICAGVLPKEKLLLDKGVRRHKRWPLFAAAGILLPLILLFFVLPGSPGFSFGEKPVLQGDCGDKLTYELSSEGVLTIQGTGMMQPYELLHPAPWRNHDVTAVVIEEGVTGIGSYAFRMNTTLTRISMPGTMEYIGDHAFDQCWTLPSVTIPSSVNYIGDGIFSACPDLDMVIVDNGNSVYDSRNYCNAVIETATDTLIAGCKATVIPDSVKAIGAQAFSTCVGLQEIRIPDSVLFIDDTAFDYCSELTIVGSPGSCAETFALSKGFTFRAEEQP